MMRRLLVALLCIVFLFGCSEDLSFSEVSKDVVNKDIKTFISNVKNENGIYLYLDKQNTIYVYLNASNVKQGEKPVHFNDFDVEGNGDTLHILYNRDKTDDYSNQSLKYELLYKVNADKKYDNIKSFSNGEEVPFDLVTGNQ